MRSILDKVLGPDVIATLRPHAEARSVCEPQAAYLESFGQNFQLLTPSAKLDLLVVVGKEQQFDHLAIA
jgi:hypothetical protein